MTRCCRNSTNLKSSDARNPRYAQTAPKQCRPSSCKLRFSDDCPSDDTIDRLAYDSRHHPYEIIKVSCRKSSSKDQSCRCRQSVSKDKVAGTAICSCLRACNVKDFSSTAGRFNLDCFNANGPRSHTRELSRPESSSHRQQQQLCTSKLADYSPQHRIHSRKSNHSGGNESEPSCSCRGALRSSSLENLTAVRGTAKSPETFRELTERKEDESRYANFVYDITQEIIQCGLYTDRELKEVFQKHLEKNCHRLNERKMLYEIYQLKISLNMTDDEEDDEEDEVEADLVYAEKFSKLRVPKAPTPPRILNENKIIEKLETFGKQLQHEDVDCSCDSSPPVNRNVVLVDPNPEFLVTERDVLSTLANEDVAPEQIQRIYRNLYQKSKDVSTCETVQVGNEMTYSHRLKRADRCSSTSSLNKAYMKERLRGILRKETTNFTSKSLSPLEKCEKWRQGLCDSEKSKHSDVPEISKQVPAEREEPLKKEPENIKEQKWQKNQKLRTSSQSPQKSVRPPTAFSRFKNSTESSKRRSKTSMESSRKDSKRSTISTQKGTASVFSRKEVKSSNEQKEVISLMEDPERSEAVTKDKMDEKPVSPKMIINVEEIEKSAEEQEEIEEEIETEVDEPPASPNSPRKSPIIEKSDNDNEKDLPTVREESEIKDEAGTLSENDSSDSDKYSDLSESSSDNDDQDATIGSPKSARTAETSERSSPRTSSPKQAPQRLEEAATRRYSTVNERIANAAHKNEHQLWPLSEASSDTSSSGSGTDRPMANNRAIIPSPHPIMDNIMLMKPVHKRTSSGQSGYKVMDSWNKKLSEITSDFYKYTEAKYCESGCRNTALPRSCAENCKFARTNCRNLSDPTECLVKMRDKSESSVSTDSS